MRADSSKVAGLNAGGYQLIETKAPAGFKKDATPHGFTIGTTGGEQELGPIVNVRHTGPALPLTGGIGTDLFLFGSLLLGGAGAVIGLRKRREANQPAIPQRPPSDFETSASPPIRKKRE